MRHGRKNKTVRIDGFKRYIARDLDEGFSALIPERPQDTRTLVNLMAIAQSLETSAYLLENLAEAIIYAAEAKDVRHPGNKLEVF